MVTAASYKAQEDKEGGGSRSGLCSQFLIDRLPEGSKVYGFVKQRSTFPHAVVIERGRPLIMIGNGSGIAPFRWVDILSSRDFFVLSFLTQFIVISRSFWQEPDQYIRPFCLLYGLLEALLDGG